METQNPMQKLVEKIKAQLEGRGASTIRGLARKFRQFDSFDGNSKIDKDEFYIGLKETGVTLTKQESDNLLSYFDKNNDGYIDFEEFLVGIRGQLSESRKTVVTKAFKKVDKDNSGFINVRDLKGTFNGKMHPKVQKGQMTEDQVYVEFLQCFCDSDKDGSISLNEWIDYYSAVSASIENDEHFI